MISKVAQESLTETWIRVEPLAYEDVRSTRMPIIECLKCGEKTDLDGRRIGSSIEIACNRCGHTWMRDTEPTCPKCGGDQLRPIQEPLIQRARGNAYSIVGQKTIHLCEVCDAAEIEPRAPAVEIERLREDPWK